jgi:hypothetical protein
MLTKDQFFALRPEIKEVQIPALGGSVYVKAMTAGERDRFEAYQEKSGNEDFRALLAVATVCDAAGVSVFSLDDLSRLSGLPSHALQAVVHEAIAVNRMGKGDVEDLKKSSSNDPADGSNFDSPPTSG